MADTYVIDSKGRAVIDKDPAATLDYTFNWTDYLSAIGSDTIASVQFTLADTASATVAAQSNTSTHATAWVSGGTVDELVKLDCKITTSSTPARVDSRSVYLKIKDM